MKEKIKFCPECGKELRIHYEPPIQEYPGGCSWPGSVSLVCSDPDCWYYEEVERIQGEIQEYPQPYDYSPFEPSGDDDY